MSEEDAKITLVNEDGEEMDYYVLEETRVNGINYLLIVDELDEEEDADAMILKDTSADSDPEAVYEIVDDEEELKSVMKIFSELIEDANFELDDDEEYI